MFGLGILKKDKRQPISMWENRCGAVSDHEENVLWAFQGRKKLPLFLNCSTKNIEFQ